MDRPDLPTALKAFDRRERGLVVGWALDNVAFSPGFEFRTQLERALPPACGPVSADAFVAMDYELRWLYGALAWSSLGKTTGQLVPDPDADLPELNWLNEDADLLVAYSKGEITHLVLIEAKGYTSWNREQIDRKVTRHRDLFLASGNRFPGVCPHLVFAGPKAPTKGDVEWADWMLRNGEPAFVPLPQPTGSKYRMTLGKKDSGQWSIKPSRWPG